MVFPDTHSVVGRTSIIDLFVKKINGEKPSTIFPKKLYL